MSEEKGKVSEIKLVYVTQLISKVHQRFIEFPLPLSWLSGWTLDSHWDQEIVQMLRCDQCLSRSAQEPA